MSLPWDVFATPLEARKLARLGVENGDVVLRPAFYRQLGASYGAVAHATCPLSGHDAPQADCSCGFYAVADEGQLWRLGADEPELAVVDVELSGRIIEHDHGYRASDQRVPRRPCPRRVRPVRAARRGVRPASVRGVGPGVPPLRAPAARSQPGVGHAGCARRLHHRRPTADAGVHTRFEFVLAQMLVPILILLTTGTVALLTNSGIPLACGQLGIVVWLVTVPSMLGRLGDRLGITGTEAVRLQHRWSPVVAAVAIGCDVVLTVVVIAARNVIAY